MGASKSKLSKKQIEELSRRTFCKIFLLEEIFKPFFSFWRWNKNLVCRFPERLSDRKALEKWICGNLPEVFSKRRCSCFRTICIQRFWQKWRRLDWIQVCFLQFHVFLFFVVNFCKRSRSHHVATSTKNLNVSNLKFRKKNILGAFQLYDLDNSGGITRAEMLEIVQAIFSMLGEDERFAQNTLSPEMRVERIFSKMDVVRKLQFFVFVIFRTVTGSCRKRNFCMEQKTTRWACRFIRF